jgi:antitoxin ParD1/3/4
MPSADNPGELANERKRRLIALDIALERGWAALSAGRVQPAEEVFDRLEAKYLRMAEERGEF